MPRGQARGRRGATSATRRAVSRALIGGLYLPLRTHLAQLVDLLHFGIRVFPRFDRDAGRSFVVGVVDAIELDIHFAEIGARGKMRANRFANLNL